MYKGTLEEFWKKIQVRVLKHEEKCASLLRFFMDPNESALNLMCTNCDFFSTVEWTVNGQSACTRESRMSESPKNLLFNTLP